MHTGAWRQRLCQEAGMLFQKANPLDVSVPTEFNRDSLQLLRGPVIGLFGQRTLRG